LHIIVWECRNMMNKKTPDPDTQFWINRLKTSCTETVALVYNGR